jgi:peptidoglycan/xylan/chitin deacetylase (PgdA/CDA1 family)
MNIKKLLIGLFLTGLAVLVTILFWEMKSKPETTQPVNQPVKTSKQSQTKPKVSSSAKTEPAEPAPPATAEPKWVKSETPIAFPILMYHHIADVVDGNTLFVPADEFKMEMETLKKAGYYTLSPDEAYRVLTTNEKPADKIIWLTFDDGYKNARDTAMPILTELGMKGSFFIITGMIGNEDKVTNDMLLEMKANPLMSFGSHTVNHPDLEFSSTEAATAELGDSKQTLDKLLNQSISVICYPAGRYNTETASLAEMAGYKLGLTTNPGLASSDNGLFALNRVRVAYGNTADSFLALIGDK